MRSVMYPNFNTRCIKVTFAAERYVHIDQGYAFKAGPLRLKQLINTLKIRILSQTSILYLIRYASVILIVGHGLLRRLPTSKHCRGENSGVKRVRTSNL